MEKVFITGINGVIGHNLVPKLVSSNNYQIHGLDITDVSESIKKDVKDFVKASVLQKPILIKTLSKNKITSIFHLAGILPMESEKFPEKTQVINSGGMATLLSTAKEVAVKEKRVLKIIYPSSIAVYGLPETEENRGKTKEDVFLDPITIYGITKLYSERLGIYYSNNYPGQIDFRSVRLPGIISAISPNNKNKGTLNLIHAVAEGSGLESYIKPKTNLPFIALPDVVNSLTQINEVDRKKLKRHVYNVSSFSMTTEELSQYINSIYPDSSISYSPDNLKQKIVDSWPAELDTTRAVNDWGFKAFFDKEKTFKEYLTSEINK